MPLNVRRFYFLSFLIAALSTGISAQTVAQTPSTPPQQTPAPVQMGPTSGDIMRERISKAKAYIAVRNYSAAVYELENIRKETADDAVRGAVNVLLMNSYLEQGDYKRAQDLLNEFYNLQKTTKPTALAQYMAVAGQVVKGARSRAERYKALGLNVSDRTLPLEALNDLEKMRETLEIVVTQSKELGQTPAKTSDAMALLEEATTSRSMLARDDYDSRRWRDVVADTREQMASSRSVVMSAVVDPNAEAAKASAPPVDANKPLEQPKQAPDTSKSAETSTQQPQSAATQTTNPQPEKTTPANLVTREREVKTDVKTPADGSVPQADKPVYIPTSTQPVAEQPKKDEPKKDESVKAPVQQPTESSPNAGPAPAPLAGSPMDVGSLISYATHQSPPVYPMVAKTMRTTGVVRVEVLIDEKGDVAQVKKVSGPTMLQDAAKEAIKKWKFKPFVRDGQPVKANGFVNFSFSI